MPTTYYQTLNGRIRGETTSGSRTNYLTDALRSVTATANTSATVVNTYRYKPYGSLLAKTGEGADPRFLWKGSRGVRHSSSTLAKLYIGRSHYAPEIAIFISRTTPKLQMSQLERVPVEPPLEPPGSSQSKLSVDLNAFINSDMFGQFIDVSGLAWWPGPFGGLLHSGTDRGPFDIRGTNRGKLIVSIDSLDIGVKSPTVKKFVGRTHLYAGGLLVINEIGHMYTLYEVKGKTHCKDSWLRIHQRYCAYLLPNTEKLCIDHKFTLVFEIGGPQLVWINLKDVSLDAFPDFDAWVSLNDKHYKNWFHVENLGHLYPHPFIGMAYHFERSDKLTWMVVPTAPLCGVGTEHVIKGGSE